MGLADELALVTKLKALGISVNHIFAGDTYRSERLEKVRLLVRSMPEVIFTIREGKAITLAQQFSRAYGESL